MKVNLGNYESADVFVSVSNVGEDTTEEEVRAILNGGVETAYKVLKEHIAGKVAAIRQKR